MSINYYLNQLSENYSKDDIPEVELYEHIENYKLRLILATMHNRLNNLFNFMYSKMNHNGNFHYNADQSRELIKWTDLFYEMQYKLQNTELSFSINDDYRFMLDQCRGFLMPAGGSSIPRDLRKIELIRYDRIFEMNSIVSVPIGDISRKYSLKQIGHGSYANVFKYRDEYYNMDIVVKKARIKDLDEKEIDRFKQEFSTMKELSSPYLIEVYRYDENLKQYYMEAADRSLKDFINLNNTKLDKRQRLEIIYQIIKGLKYIHSKEMFHRDLSLNNILIKEYDHLIVAKLCDFGLVKIKDSTLTSMGSEVKGTFIDPHLYSDGFENYALTHEVYALTCVITFILTGKTNFSTITEQKYLEFYKQGTNVVKESRFQTLDDVRDAVSKL